jgi:hypothetical protein
MRKKLLILSVFILLALAPNIFGQKAQRITFKRGATVAVVSGYLKSYKDQKVFVIRVRKGQTLNTEQVGSNYITVGIESPSGEEINDADASCNNRKEITPTEAGDYKITVYECGKADEWRGTFKLKISVK